MKNINTNNNTDNTIPTINAGMFTAARDLFPGGALKVFDTFKADLISPAPVVFKGAVIRAAAMAEGTKAARMSAARKVKAAALTAKADTLEEEAAARIPAGYIPIEVTFKGMKRTIHGEKYVEALRAEAATLTEEAAALEAKADNFKAAAAAIPVIPLTEEAAKVVRVYAASIFGGACSIRAEQCPGLKEAVTASKKWTAATADHVGPVDTTTADWKIMKDAVTAFLQAFSTTTAGEVVKKKVVNLNAAEIAFLAAKVFSTSIIRWRNEGTKEAPSFEMTCTPEGAVKFEKELVNLLVFKYEGKRLTTSAPVKSGK